MLQMRLNDLGYSVGTADGVYGGKTAEAVSAFQQEHGMDATGEVDEATWNALYEEAITITQKGATIDVLLTAPFVDIEQDVDGAVLRMDEMICTVNISDFGLIYSLCCGIFF